MSDAGPDVRSFSLRSHAVVRVVQTSEDGRRHELARPRDVEGFIRDRRLAAEALVRSLGVVVVVDELVEEPFEVALAQRDDVVEKLAAQRAVEPLDVGVLPGAMDGNRNLLDAAAIQERRLSCSRPVSLPSEPDPSPTAP